MIILILKGGLGNQLFQYAFAKYLSDVNNCTLYIDTVTGFKNDPFNRNFALNDFNITSIDLSEIKSNSFFIYCKIKFIILLRHVSFIRKTFFLSEIVYHFDEKLKNRRIQRLTIIDGYFQTEKYFIEISKVLRNEFKFNSEPLGENLYYYNSIKKNSTATVSIHVRKYDNPHTVDVSSINGNCTIEYYNDAIDYFIMKFRDVIFYAFSDDMNWLKSNINFKNQVIHYVDHNHSQNAYEDLRLMSICDHNIIANSSFSWWGAWLNHNPNKIIIAPKVWLLANEFDYSDVIPEKWIKI